jgi:hypothetical protein
VKQEKLHDLVEQRNYDQRRDQRHHLSNPLAFFAASATAHVVRLTPVSVSSATNVPECSARRAQPATAWASGAGAGLSLDRARPPQMIRSTSIQTAELRTVNQTRRAAMSQVLFRIRKILAMPAAGVDIVRQDLEGRRK